jgi:ubiquinone/menaquinone biosynthesis C-methylase UbiE
MTSTFISRVKHLEPPPWLYARMARGSWFRMIYRRFVADLETLPRGARVLDVGTGPGYLLGHLARTRPDLDLWGLDHSYSMIRRGHGRQSLPGPTRGPRWIVADAQALPFPAGSFDQAVSTFSFHNWDRPVTGLREMQRVLGPGGRAWVYELRRETSPDEMRAFAQEERLPYRFVHLGLKTLSWHHAIPLADFTALLTQAAGDRGRLRPVHHLFWRAELTRT